MTDDELISLLRARTRSTSAAPPVSPSDLAAVESSLGFSLTPVLRRVLLEVCNGGLFGIFGVPTAGRVLDADISILAVREQLFDPLDDDLAVLRDAIPFVDLGCAQWLWVGPDGIVLSMVDAALYRTPASLSDWLVAALAGNEHDLIFARGPGRPGINPFTKEPFVFETFTPRGQKLFELTVDGHEQ